MARILSLFLGYADFIPDDDYTIKRTAFIPYLFTDKELSALFHNIDSYTGATRGKRYLPEVVLPVYTRLLYCCGLRPQEPPAILADDVDLETGDVYIRKSKRHKDRHIIMSEDMLRLCRRYDSVAASLPEIRFSSWQAQLVLSKMGRHAL